MLLRIDEAVSLLEAVLSIETTYPLARLAWCRLKSGALEEVRRLYQASG
jgi:hypothetical protein